MSIRFFIVLLAAPFILGGCQTAQLQVNSLQQAQPSLAAPVEPKLFRPPVEIFADQQKKFDLAYQKAALEKLAEEMPSGAFLSVNVNRLDPAASFFKSLGNKREFQTIVVLQPAFQSGEAEMSAAWNPLQTPYGLLETDLELLQKISPKLIREKPYTSANTQNLLAPLIKKSFPGARYVALFIPENIEASQLNRLADLLRLHLPPRSLLLATGNVLVSGNADVDRFQQKFSQNVFQTLDETALPNLPLTTKAPTQVLFSYLKAKGARESHLERSNLVYYTDGPASAQRKIFFVTFGDIMLGRYVRTLMDRSSLDYPFEKMNQSYLQYNDFLLANLEGPIAHKTELVRKGLAFRFAPDVAPLLKKYFFDVLSLANNHALDMGEEGYKDSVDLLKAQGIIPFGHPRDISDLSVARLEIGGRKIAFLGLDDIDSQIDISGALAKTKELVAAGYQVIPFIHWGIEYTHTSNKNQRDLAHALIDAGAFMIIAHHPHVVQSHEIYNGRHIYYSLGNAVFDQYFSKATQEGLSLGLILGENDVETHLFPIKIERSQMRLMNESERKEFVSRFEKF